MRSGEALKAIREAGETGNVRFRDHMFARLDKWNLTEVDVFHGLATAIACRRQEHGTWLVDCLDLDDEPFFAAVEFIDGVLVTTVFR